MDRDDVIEALLARIAALEADVATLMAERADREEALDEMAGAFAAEARHGV